MSGAKDQSHFGGVELFDYTFKLYKPSTWGVNLKKYDVKPAPVFADYGKVFVSAKLDSVTGTSRDIKDAIVFVDRWLQYLMIESPYVKYNSEVNSIESDFGRIRILNKKVESTIPETDGYYKNLIVNLRNDVVGITIIMKELVR